MATVPDEAQADTETIDESEELGGVTHPTRPRVVLDVGEVIGRYVIQGKLGAGGVGVVYAAYDPEFDRKVAIKLLRRDAHGFVLQGAARARFVRESQLVARFSHPEIVAIYDVGEHESGVWLAMEFVDGQTLAAWAQQAPRTWQEVLAVMLAAGRGVAAAHVVGLVHQDLRSDNIMISADGRVHVMEVGLMREQDDAEPNVSGDDRLEQPELFNCNNGFRMGLAGTPAHVAPEQYSGGRVTGASDQFAYCVTMWELLYGELPFRGRTTMELIASMQRGRVRAPPKQRAVPTWLRKVCERGLASEPSQRWPSMQALLHALEHGEGRVRARKLAFGLALVVGLGIGAAAWGQHEHARTIDACTQAGAEIEDAWNDEQDAVRVRANCDERED